MTTIGYGNSLKVVRVRIANKSTEKSKNLRIGASMFDDSIHELIFDNPSIQEAGILQWPLDQQQQLNQERGQIHYVMKRRHAKNIVFLPRDIEKTSIQDLLNFQKEDENDDGDVSPDDDYIHLELQFSSVKSSIRANPTFFSERIETALSRSNSARSFASIPHQQNPLSPIPTSPSIMKKANSPKSNKSVQFQMKDLLELPVD